MNPIAEGVVIGIATAAVLGIMAWLWRQGRERRVKQLADLMGTIIEHRNAGRRPVADPVAWVKRAKDLEQEAEQRASKVSAASAALIHWLGELNDIGVATNVQDRDQQQYILVLTTVISRIRDTLERHDQ